MKQKKKVLVYAPIRYPNAEIDYILTVCQRLIPRGFEFAVMANPGTPMRESAAKAGLKVEDRFDLTTFNPARLWKNISGLRDWLDQERFDIIDVHRSEGYVLLARLIAKLSPRPALVRTRQDMRPARTDPVNRWAYRSADRIIVSNQLLADDLITRLALEPSKLAVVHYGINPESFQPKKPLDQVRKEKGIDPAWRIVGLSARLGTVKGHQYFLEAAQKISEQVPEARFLISYRMIEKESDFLTRLAKSPLKKKFLLFSPSEDRAEILNLCEVGVLTSVGSEASSRACLEWMVLKKPVVVTRVGTLPELVITGETGYLVMPRYASGTAEAVIRLLKFPDRAREMGERGYDLLKEKFTEDIMIERTVEVFDQVAGKKR
jgi:glycosyltransferase involved in cell wall biosynthesis